MPVFSTCSPGVSRKAVPGCQEEPLAHEGHTLAAGSTCVNLGERLHLADVSPQDQPGFCRVVQVLDFAKHMVSPEPNQHYNENLRFIKDKQWLNLKTTSIEVWKYIQLSAVCFSALITFQPLGGCYPEYFFQNKSYAATCHELQTELQLDGMDDGNLEGLRLPRWCHRTPWGPKAHSHGLPQEADTQYLGDIILLIKLQSHLKQKLQKCAQEHTLPCTLFLRYCRLNLAPSHTEQALYPQPRPESSCTFF